MAETEADLRRAPGPPPAEIAGGAMLRAVFDIIQDGILIVDAAGRYVDVNESLCRILRAPRERLLGAYFHEFTPADRLAEAAAAFASLKTTGSFEGEFPMRAADGTLVELAWRSHSDFFPGLHLCVAREIGDISARRRAEQELQEANRELQVANQELQVTEEELRVQNDELLVTRMAIENERARYRELFETAPDGYLVTDLEGTIRQANRTAAEQLAVPAPELAGRPLAELVHPDDRRAFRARLLARLGHGPRSRRWELRLLPAGKRPFIAALTVAPVAGAAGDTVGWRFLVRDVSERREAEARYARLLAREREAHAEAEAARQRSELLAEASSILASSLDDVQNLGAVGRLAVPRLADYCLIFELDGAGGFQQLTAVHADPAQEPLLACTVELYRLLLANPASHLARALASGRPELVRDVAAAPALAALEPELHAMVDERAPRSALVLPLAARGQTLGVLLLVTTADSARAYGERDLAMGAELARRIAMALDNARLYREARAANAAKDRFLATLSHELRTPLTPVLALTSALAEDERLPGEARGSLERVRRNVELEARLIDDLLDLTRIARGKLELHREVTDLADLIDQALLTCCAEAVADGRITVSTDLAAGDHRVWADPPRLTQVLWNLFNNAVKFTSPPGQAAPPPGAPARVTVRSWAEEGPEGETWLAVEVRDQGIGIDAEALPRIFDGFEQGERSITRRFGGLGLGLAVSQAIAELHGGTLTAASPGPGQGSTFTLRVPRGPLAASAAAQPAAPRTAAPAAGGEAARADLHILLVEDHADTAAAMAELLGAGGHRVTVADSVASGLAAAAAAAGARRPGAPGGIDLVLSDLGLPDGSGLDLMRELAGRYGLPGIALSGYGMEEDVRKSREAGFLRHLTKPVTLQALRAAIAEATRERA